MTKSMKRIHKVTIKTMVDDSPDTSCLGEYSSKQTSDYSIDRAHSLDCPINTELQEPQCDCDEHGDMGRNEYRYFNPSDNYKYETPANIRKYVLQDYKRMEALNRGDWCFLGIRAEASYYITSDFLSSAMPMQKVTSGGLWGIESDSDKVFIKSTEDEQLAKLREQLHALGFSKRAIAAAFKTVEHSRD